MMREVEFVKGHGTGNDFVLLPDPSDELDLTDSRVRALCDRHCGVGADGVLRVVPGGLVPDAPRGTSPDDWFMDYRNADGSRAEMCGNGVRVFARYLSQAGLVTGTEFRVGSRAGPRAVWLTGDGSVGVEMGPVDLRGTSTAIVAGAAFPGLVVDVGNPHLACVTESSVDQLDLTVAPGYDPERFPRGVNIEFVAVLGPDRLRMRVYERGVGETRSCGTGTVAAAAAALQAAGQSTGAVAVRVPGGTVRVTISPEGSTLTGPAVLVARGRIDPEWWAAS